MKAVIIFSFFYAFSIVVMATVMLIRSYINFYKIKKNKQL